MMTYMSEVKIKFVKTHDDAKLPTKGHDDDNCFDLYAVERVRIPGTSVSVYSSKVTVGNAVVPVGLKVGHITPGFGFVIKGRSGLGFKHGIQPHFGEIDNGYRGDIGVKLYNLSADDYWIEKGDRVAQIKIEKVYDTTLSFDDETTESSRGEGKFGSTGQ